MHWLNNNNNYRRNDKTAARFINIVCGVLFIVFSTVYLIYFQNDLIEAVHCSISKGNKDFNIIPAAIIIITILLIMRWGLNLLMKLRGNLSALAYLPSFLGLVTMTAFGRDLYTDCNSYIWWWLMPLLTVAFVIVVVAIRKAMRIKGQTAVELTNGLIWNITLMLIMSIGTVCLGNTDRYMHNELRMENLIAKDNNAEALKVAGKSLKATRTMTALRMLAMTKEEDTGEMLFKFPQYYKENGLFFDDDPTKTLRYTNDSIYSFLGERPMTGERKMDYLKRLAYRGDTCYYNARLYYMAGLMLEKDIDGYAKALKDFDIKGDSLKRYFKEAALMYKEKYPQWNFEIDDKDSICHKMLERYRYRQKDFYKSKDEERNRMRMEFGDTFLWYYDYQE